MSAGDIMEVSTPSRSLKAGSKQQTYKFVTTLKRDRVWRFWGEQKPVEWKCYTTGW